MKFLSSPIRFYLGLILLGLSVTVAAASVQPVITIKTKQGDVVFHHLDHQIRTKGECVQCHHEGAGVHPCRDCHDGKTVRAAREVVHKMCRDCHNDQGKSASPMTCEGCHE